MKPTTKICSVLFAVVLALAALTASAQQKKPNVVMLMSDDTGWADLGV